MAKLKEKKSLASLIGNREIDTTKIDKAAKKVHQTELPKKEKTIRVSVDTPMSVYLKCKETSLREGISMRDLFLKTVSEYVESK